MTLTSTKFNDQLLELANKYGVKLKRDKVNDCTNNGWHASGRIIYLGTFEDPDLEIVAFYHELGHIFSQMIRRRGSMMCHLSDEGLAWEIGLDLAYNDGYKWESNSKQYVYAYDRLSTYIQTGIWGHQDPIQWKRTQVQE